MAEAYFVDDTNSDNMDSLGCDIWRHHPEPYVSSEQDPTIPKGKYVTVECLKYLDESKAAYYLCIDFGDEPCLTLSGQNDSKEIIVKGCDIRYAKLFHAQLTILLSYWCAEGNIGIVYLKFGAQNKLLLALNGIRRCIFLGCNRSEARLNNFFPISSGIISGCIVLGNKTMEKKPLLFIIDQQALLLFETVGFATQICYFYKEPGPNVVNKMEYDRAGKQLNVTTGNAVVVIYLDDNDKSCTAQVESDFHFGNLLLNIRSVKACSKNMWKDVNEYTSHYLKQCNAWGMKQGCYGESRWQDLEQSEKPWKMEAWDAPTYPEGYFADQDVDTALSESVTVEMLIGKEAENPSEEMLEWWSTAETILNSIISEGLVPWSSIESGGLDPNSVEHFCRCVDEIQGALFEQNYAQALSVIKGLCREFETSRYEAVKKVLAMDHVHILRRIYFKT